MHVDAVSCTLRTSVFVHCFISVLPNVGFAAARSIILSSALFTILATVNRIALCGGLSSHLCIRRLHFNQPIPRTISPCPGCE